MELRLIPLPVLLRKVAKNYRKLLSQIDPTDPHNISTTPFKNHIIDTAESYLMAKLAYKPIVILETILNNTSLDMESKAIHIQTFIMILADWTLILTSFPHNSQTNLEWLKTHCHTLQQSMPLFIPQCIDLTEDMLQLVSPLHKDNQYFSRY